jgi:SNF2 family DNA or RNA helicase
LDIASEINTRQQACSNSYEKVLRRLTSEDQKLLNRKVTKQRRFKSWTAGAGGVWSYQDYLENQPVFENMTKMQALKKDLLALRAKEPHMHAVVFTQHTMTHTAVTTMINQMGITTYELKSGVSAKKRHQQIQDFQAQQAAAKVIISTLKVGNCGITLTAATRVYLMEPFIDPAHEVQAAGRIHRLGQLKEVLVKRFCFRKSFDEAVCDLHRKIKKGEVSVENGALPGSAVREMLKM